jgi:two-component system KDP operon response regulator KdpE
MDASEQLAAPSSDVIPELAGDRVLVLSDDSVLVDAVKVALSQGPVAVRRARDKAEASAALASWRPHLALVDMSLDDGQLLEELALAPGPDTRLPVLALMRRDALHGWLSMVERGADDILLIPFSPEELIARVRILLRRVYRRPVTFSPVIRVGELEIDLLRRRVGLDDMEAQLTPLEQSLLYLFVADPGRVLTRDEILNAVWGPDYMANSNIVDQHVVSLRRKLQNHWQRPRYIETVAGQGYRFLIGDPPQQRPIADDPPPDALPLCGALRAA